MKSTKKQQKTTKFLAANTNYGYKSALLKHNDNQTYTFGFQKKKKKKSRPTDQGILQYFQAGPDSSVTCTSDSHSFSPLVRQNIFSWRLVMKWFLRPFSPYHCFKWGSCRLLAKGLSLTRKSVVRLTDCLNMRTVVDWDVKQTNKKWYFQFRNFMVFFSLGILRYFSA